MWLKYMFIYLNLFLIFYIFDTIFVFFASGGCRGAASRGSWQTPPDSKALFGFLLQIGRVGPGGFVLRGLSECRRAADREGQVSGSSVEVAIDGPAMKPDLRRFDCQRTSGGLPSLYSGAVRPLLSEYHLASVLAR